MSLSIFANHAYVASFLAFRALEPAILRAWGSLVLSNILTCIHDKHVRMLDIGCGTGRFSTLFSRHLDVVGIDQSPAMLNVARQSLEGIDGHSFHGVLANFLDYHSATRFNAAFASEVLHLFPEIDAFIEKTSTLLCPRGTLHIRTATKDQAAARTFLSYFPTALNSEIQRHCDLAILVKKLKLHGFFHISTTAIDESVYVEKALLLDAMKHRFHSALYEITNDELTRGVELAAVDLSAPAVQLVFPMTYICATRGD